MNLKHLPWKKIGKGALKIIAIGAAATDNPHLDFLNDLIEGVEHQMPTAPGADKLALVESMSDAALAAAVKAGQLTQAVADRIRALRARYVAIYVEIRHLQAEAEAAWDEVQDLAKGGA